jgi:hypothetical protein
MISSTGRWKVWLVGGMVAVVLGTGLLGTIDHTTSLWVIGAWMLILGAGLGCTQQNLILAVQNNVDQANIGAASSVVAFFRSIGGSIGVSALGAVLSHHVTDSVTRGLARIGVHPAESGQGSSSIPNLATLPPPVRAIFESAFGDATGRIFLYAAPFALIAFVAILFIREVPLRTTIERSDELSGAAGRAS